MMFRWLYQVPLVKTLDYIIIKLYLEVDSKMARKLEIELKETQAELKKLLHQSPSGRQKERVEALYLFKTPPAETALVIARLIGGSYSTVTTWLRTYRQHGIEGLLEIKPGGGRALSLDTPVLEALNQKLKQSEGFASDEAIQVWLAEHYGIELGYSTVHGLVHDRLKARPKVVRPQSAQRDESCALDFEKNRHYD